MTRKKINIVSLEMVKKSHQWYSKRVIRSPEDAEEVLREYLGTPDREHLVLLCLNTKYEPTHIETISVGSLDTTMFHPREIFKTAIMTNSAAIIIGHNHPSGSCEASPQDEEMGKRINKAGEIIGIDVLDSLIIGEYSFTSLKEIDMF